jgi:hypothetical protein
MHRNLLLLVHRLALAALAVSLGGCLGQPRFDVTGQVKYNGAPLAKENGQIVFLSNEGVLVTAPISPDGTYKAFKVGGGRNQVAVHYPNPAFKKATRPKGAPDPKHRPALASPFLTPEKYADAKKSGLSVEVKQGTVFDVDLTGPKIP